MVIFLADKVVAPRERAAPSMVAGLPTVTAPTAISRLRTSATLSRPSRQAPAGVWPAAMAGDVTRRGRGCSLRHDQMRPGRS